MSDSRWPPDELTCRQHSVRPPNRLRGVPNYNAIRRFPSDASGAALPVARRASAAKGDGAGSDGSGDAGDGASGELYLGRFAALTALYALAEGAMTHPYELIKTRQQAGAPRALAHRMSTGRYLVHLAESGGLRELYRGFGWSVLGGVPSEVVYYVGYTETKRALLGTAAGAASPSSVYLAAGAFADALSVLVSVPADVISQRLQLQGADARGADAAPTARPQHGHGAAALPSMGLASASRARHLHAPPPLLSGGTAAGGLEIAASIVRQEGPLGLWRGTGATLAYYGPNSAVWWLTHEHAKGALAERLDGLCAGECAAGGAAGGAEGGAEGEPSSAVLAMSGALAGATSTVATNPLDLIKTRLQTSTRPTSVGSVLAAVWKEARWRGLYAGLVPRLFSAIPRSICTVLAYERAVEFCRK